MTDKITTKATSAMLPNQLSSINGGGGGSSIQSLPPQSNNSLQRQHRYHQSHLSKPFVVRNGRTYLTDTTLPYPLPVDLTELHLQTLRTLFLFQVFGGPVCSPAFANKPPTRVLEIGCGSAFWSQMCDQYYAHKGHRFISFTGMDIAPIGLGANSAGGKSRSSYATAVDRGKERNKRKMDWRFVQHDIRRTPWPFTADEFDLVMVKDMSLAISTNDYQTVIDECIRILQPGGTLEVWDSDHAIRMLRPHTPEPPTASAGLTDGAGYPHIAVGSGAYVLTPNTPVSAALNPFIVDYNGWVVKALEGRSLPFAPCAMAAALFLQEAESLTNTSSLRLVVPLSEMRWEREGVGGVVTKDGKAFIETGKAKGKARAAGKPLETPREGDQRRRTVTTAQSALRRTALLTVVQMIQSLEPVLREVSGKSQDEWDTWMGKMKNNLMKEGGTSWGECLEIGAWWAQKR